MYQNIGYSNLQRLGIALIFLSAILIFGIAPCYGQKPQLIDLEKVGTRATEAQVNARYDKVKKEVYSRTKNISANDTAPTNFSQSHGAIVIFRDDMDGGSDNISIYFITPYLPANSLIQPLANATSGQVRLPSYFTPQGQSLTNVVLRVWKGSLTQLGVSRSSFIVMVYLADGSQQIQFAPLSTDISDDYNHNLLSADAQDRFIFIRTAKDPIGISNIAIGLNYLGTDTVTQQSDGLIVLAVPQNLYETLEKGYYTVTIVDSYDTVDQVKVRLNGRRQ